MKKKKLKTTIMHSFDIETNIMDGFVFVMGIEESTVKKKTRIIEVKKRKIVKDASTRLF